MNIPNREAAGGTIRSVALPTALLVPECYPHGGGRIELVETHISWVFLAGEHAYKVKKPLKLGFLDFSTLDARRRACEEELRLNRRTAAELYLEVVPITQESGAPRVEGRGTPIEYALKMRRFPQEALADRIAKSGRLGADKVEALASVLAAFHAAIARSGESERFGTPEAVEGPALANFEEIATLDGGAEDSSRIAHLRDWTAREGARLQEVFSARKRDGYVRECHGDLHLGNIVFLDGRPVLFDCIEFNADFRWIDVMNEAAFLFMDLLDHRLQPAAWRFLNAYLEATGDYAGVRVLSYYAVYRAMVRAKVALIRRRQPGGKATGLSDDYHGYLALAGSQSVADRSGIVLMHGLAGSGKTTISQYLLERLRAVRVRSDVERKRLHGLAPLARTHSAHGSGIYAPEATRALYDRLAEAAREILASGRLVIIDAAFLARARRQEFRAIAGELGVPLVIASCRAREVVLRARVAAREVTASDASEAGIAVLENQLETAEAPGSDESPQVVEIDSEADESGLRAAADRIAALLSRNKS